MEEYEAEAYCAELAQETSSLMLFLIKNGSQYFLPCSHSGDEFTFVAVTIDGEQKVTTAAAETISPVDAQSFLGGDNAESIQFVEIPLEELNINSCIGVNAWEY